jgi:hypothetical protein
VVSTKDPAHFRTTPDGDFHGMVAKAKAGELNIDRTLWAGRREIDGGANIGAARHRHRLCRRRRQQLGDYAIHLGPEQAGGTRPHQCRCSASNYRGPECWRGSPGSRHPLAGPRCVVVPRVLVT